MQDLDIILILYTALQRTNLPNILLPALSCIGTLINFFSKIESKVSAIA